MINSLVVFLSLVSLFSLSLPFPFISPSKFHSSPSSPSSSSIIISIPTAQCLCSLPSLSSSLLPSLLVCSDNGYDVVLLTNITSSTSSGVQIDWDFADGFNDPADLLFVNISNIHTESSSSSPSLLLFSANFWGADFSSLSLSSLPSLPPPSPLHPDTFLSSIALNNPYRMSIDTLSTPTDNYIYVVSAGANLIVKISVMSRSVVGMVSGVERGRGTGVAIDNNYVISKDNDNDNSSYSKGLLYYVDSMHQNIYTLPLSSFSLYPPPSFPPFTLLFSSTLYPITDSILFDHSHHLFACAEYHILMMNAQGDKYLVVEEGMNQPMGIVWDRTEGEYLWAINSGDDTVRRFKMMREYQVMWEEKFGKE